MSILLEKVWIFSEFSLIFENTVYEKKKFEAVTVKLLVQLLERQVKKIHKIKDCLHTPSHSKVRFGKNFNYIPMESKSENKSMVIDTLKTLIFA